MAHAFVFVAAGIASYYTRKSSGATMADGQPMTDSAHICATRHLVPFGTRLDLVNEENGKESWCIVTDYGPAAWTGRVIDVSIPVRNDLGFTGTARVRIYRRIFIKDSPAPPPGICLTSCDVACVRTVCPM